MLHKADGTNFDGGRSEIWENCFGIRMMSYAYPTRGGGGVAHKIDCNFTMLGVMLKIKIDAYEISYFLRLFSRSGGRT